MGIYYKYLLVFSDVFDVKNLHLGYFVFAFKMLTIVQDNKILIDKNLPGQKLKI